ncbi:hypothetical protein ACX0G9_09155 [Flavitalea flava]
MTLFSSTEQKLHYTLRIAVAMCFIGHGAFGIITKPVWCNYFAVFGIGHDLAYRLMPLLGSVDILLGIVMLIFPVRAIAAWLVLWGIVTALLRPLSGEAFAEFIERAGNFGAPLAFLILTDPGTMQGAGKGFREWFTRVNPDQTVDPDTMRKVAWCLRIVVFFLLLGHGWLNLIEKKGLIGQYTALGLPNPAKTALLVGLFEVMAAFAVLIRPVRPILFGLFLWKMASELFYPHYELFEWVERAGSYGALFALWLVSKKKASAAVGNYSRMGKLAT